MSGVPKAPAAPRLRAIREAWLRPVIEQLQADPDISAAETEEDRDSFDGPKHWHYYEIIASRPNRTLASIPHLSWTARTLASRNSHSRGIPARRTDEKGSRIRPGNSGLL